MTAVEGGKPSEYTIVPDRCAVSVDLRLTPTFDQRAAEQLLAGVVGAVDAAWQRLGPP